MSESWDAWCSTCSSGAGIDINHGEQEIATLIQNARQIGALNHTGLEVSANYGNVRVPLDWFAQHADHELTGKNEYGGFLNTCETRFVCKCCNQDARCNLPPKHDGDHAKVPK